MKYLALPIKCYIELFSVNFSFSFFITVILNLYCTVYCLLKIFISYCQVTLYIFKNSETYCLYIAISFTESD